MQFRKSVNYLIIIVLLISFISQIYLINDSFQDSKEIQGINDNFDINTTGQTISDPIVRYPKYNQVNSGPIKLNDTRDNNIDFFQSPNQNQLSMNSIDNYKVADNSIYSNWQTGRSITVEYESVTSIPSNNYIQSHRSSSTSVSCDYSVVSSSSSFRFTESTYYKGYRTTCDSSVTWLDSQVYFEIPASTAGTIYYKLAPYTRNPASEQTNTPYSGSISISASEISNFIVNGKLTVMLLGSDSDWAFKVIGSTSTKGGGNLASGVTSPTVAEIRVYHLYYIPDIITSEVRSEYIYTSSSTITHKLSLENWEYNNEVTIKKPISWQYSSISPSATVTPSGDDIIISGTVPTTYTVLFTETNNYYLALEEVTDDYLQYPSFEGGFLDWSEYSSTYEFGNELSLRSDKVFEGGYAMYLEDNDNTNIFQIGYNSQDSRLDSGEYYISFSLYSATVQTLSFYTFDTNGATDHLITTVAGKWTTYFYFETIHDTGGRFFQFSNLDAGEGLYLDNFRIFKSSGKVETVGYNEYEMSATVLSWDGLQNPILPNTGVEFSLRDRTADTEIFSKTLSTDINGIASYNFRDILEQKEYEIMTNITSQTYNTSSYFTPVFSDELSYSYENKINGDKNYWDFSESTDEGWDTTWHVSSSVQDGYQRFKSDGLYSTTPLIAMTNSPSIDLSFYNSLQLRVRGSANMTSSNNLYIYNNAGISVQNLGILSQTWKIIDVDLGPWTDNETNMYYFRIIGSAVANAYIDIDYILPYHKENGSLYETENSFILSSTNDTRSYYYTLDNFTGYTTDLEYISKNMSLGDHTFNYTIIYDSSIDSNLVQLPSVWYSYSYTIIEVEPDLTIEYLSFLPLDSYLSFQFGTNWANQTASIYENGTLIGNTNEDTVYTWNRNTNYTIKINVTILINKYVLTYWYENAAQQVSTTLVHFILTNEVGIGLDANTAKVVVNGTTIYTLDQYYSPGIFLNITVYSWSNDLLYITNGTVNSAEQEIILILPIYEQEFRNDYNFDVLLTLTSKTNSNYTISKIVPANSSIIIEMFESTFNVNFSPIISNSAGTTFANATHIISYSEVDKVIEFRKGLKAVRVDLSLSAISLTVEELTWFEKNVLPPMIAIFGVTGGVGLLVAIVLLALRSFGINLFRENIIEKPVQRFGEETGFFTMSDDEDLSFSKKKKRKFKYKNKYI